MLLNIIGCAQNQPNPNETPQQTAKTKTQAFYYTADEGGSITKIDASSNSVVNTIPINGIVHNIQVSPDGKIVGATFIPTMQQSASMEMNGKALFYDSTTDKLIKQVQVGNHPAHITNSVHPLMGTPGSPLHFLYSLRNINQVCLNLLGKFADFFCDNRKSATVFSRDVTF